MDVSCQTISSDGIRLSFLKVFVDLCGGGERLTGKTTREVWEDHIIPVTQSASCSYCHMLIKEEAKRQFVGKANVFVSHPWQLPFLSMISTLLAKYSPISSSSSSSNGNASENEDEVILWMDIFCLYYPPLVLPSTSLVTLVESEKSDWIVKHFQPFLASMPKVLILVDITFAVLQYTWCLFEIFCCDSSCLDLLCLDSSELFWKNFFAEPSRRMEELLSFSLGHSQTTIPSDRDALFQAILSITSFNAFHVKVRQSLLYWLDDQKPLKSRIEHDVILRAVWMYYHSRSHESWQLLEDFWREEESSLSSMPPPSKKMAKYRIRALIAMEGMIVGVPPATQGENIVPQLVRRWRDTISLCQVAYGTNHVMTWSAMTHLAHCLAIAKQVDEAESLYETILHRRQGLQGDDHIDVSQVLQDLALLYYHQRRYTEAEKLYRSCLERLTASLGIYHPRGVQILSRLGKVYYEDGRYSLAEEVFKDCLNRYRTIWGPFHEDSLMAGRNLALVYYVQQREKDAEDLLSDCLAVSKRCFGVDHPETLLIALDLCQVYHSAGKFELGDVLVMEVFRYRKRLRQKSGRSVILAWYQLATLLIEQDKLEQAELVCVEGLGRCQDLWGRKDELTRQFVHTMAVLYTKRGMGGGGSRQQYWQLAETFYEECYQLCCESLGEGHAESCKVDEERKKLFSSNNNMILSNWR
eukprot:scaffold1290_cov248-Ochromonas_danica.AAC.32